MIDALKNALLHGEGFFPEEVTNIYDEYEKNLSRIIDEIKKYESRCLYHSANGLQPVPKANAQFFIYKRRENGKQICYET